MRPRMNIQNLIGWQLRHVLGAQVSRVPQGAQLPRPRPTPLPNIREESRVGGTCRVRCTYTNSLLRAGAGGLRVRRISHKRLQMCYNHLELKLRKWLFSKLEYENDLEIYRFLKIRRAEQLLAIRANSIS